MIYFCPAKKQKKPNTYSFQSFNMPLNDIQLPASLLADLYGQMLVLTDDAEKVKGKRIKGEGVAEDHVSGIAEEYVADSTPHPSPSASDLTPSAFPPSASSWQALGHNQKDISIVVNYAGITHLPDPELQFLTNILSACKLSLADVAIVNYHSHAGTPVRRFLDHFHSKTVLLFGVTPDQFGLSARFPEFQVQQLAGVTYLSSPPLEICSADVQLKKQLWTSLKRIFSI
ncbi:MAG: hypothetical protein GXC78_02420 [Chitinophagaceae bacterium]|nr:hypothetical protein [Chitinophagaceae bacterium]